MVGYQNVYEGPEMTMCIFTLPAGSRLPLHDHPGMTVFGRLLFGKMQVRPYDLDGKAEEPSFNLFSWSPSPRKVVQRGETVHGPEPVTYHLTPDHGNLHEIVALEDMAFFDVLFPPYSESEGRPCNYYAIGKDPKTGDAVVVPARPDGLRMTGQPYRGPLFPR